MSSRTANLVLVGLLVLVAFPARVQAVWMPEGFRAIYENGFSKNYELMTTVYIYETILLLGLVFFLFNYFSGKGTNRKIAQRWVSANLELFKEQFSVVGLNEANTVEPFPLLDEESPNFFKFFATGRVNVKYCMVSLEMQRRQDLLMSYIYSMVWAQKDRISFDIPFHIDGQSPPLCFAIMKKKVETEALDGYKDLKHMTKKFKVDGVSDKYSIYSDHVELLGWLFDRNLKDFLAKYEKHVEMIHVTDRQTFFKTPLALRVTMLLPSLGADFEKNSKEQTKFVLGMIERLMSYRPLPKIREKLDQLRVNYEATVSVDEEKQKKHEEKLKEEKEKKLAAMDPDQRKKLEEKRAKAKMMKKFKVN